MQKQKIDQSVFYLVLTSDYEMVHCGLYKAGEQVAVCQEQKLAASRNLMLMLSTMLSENGVSWADLSCVGVNQGPSPFTTLRVVITTVNGLLLSLQKPIIGVDGLATFLNEQYQGGVLVALLNAFNHDLYFGIKTDSGSCETGWEFNGTLLVSLQNRFGAQPITFIGNGAGIYREQIMNLFPHALILGQPSTQSGKASATMDTVSLAAVAAQTYKLYLEGKGQHEPLLPLYLKTMNYIPST